MGTQLRNNSVKVHKVLMILCCVIPVAAVAYYFTRGQGFSWSILMVLACPLMHIFMMKSHGNDGHETENCHSEAKRLPETGEAGKP